MALAARLRLAERILFSAQQHPLEEDTAAPLIMVLERQEDRVVVAAKLRRPRLLEEQGPPIKDLPVGTAAAGELAALEAGAVLHKPAK